MAESVKQLLRSALKLPPGERAHLVAALLASLELDVPGEARSADEWVAEIERRARAAIAGAPGLDPAEARARREALLAPEARGGRG